MTRKVIYIRVLLVISWWLILAYASTCTRYTFEEDFDELFSWSPVCGNDPYPWHVGSFEDFKPSSPFHERSTHFIYALPEVSCVRSFTFPMNEGGIVEVNMYIENPTLDDFVQVIAYNDLQFVGSAQRNGANYPGGWYTMRFTTSGSEQFLGHLVFIGVSTQNSTVLMDSFRYLPPGMIESDCKIYELDQTTTESTTESTERPPENPSECPPRKAIELEIKTTLTINFV